MPRPLLAAACAFAALCSLAPGAFAQRPAPMPMTPPAGTAQRAVPPADNRRANEDEACRARHAAYQRSQACYAQFRSFQAVRPEALSVCGPPLLDPSPECGPPPPYR